MVKVQLAPEYEIRIPKEYFNSAYYPYLDKIYRNEIYFGGSSSGKSTFIGQKLAMQMSLLENRNLVCLRKQGSDARDSVYPEIQSALYKFGLLDLWNVVESPEPKMTNRKNGNVIAFTGLDSAENIKSIKFKQGKNLTDIWYEEATEEYDMKNFRELRRRLRGGLEKKRIIISFNPIYSTHPLKEYIEKELAGEDTLILKTTYKDNKFLSKEDIFELERYKYSSPYDYQVYALGDWGTTGQIVFDANLIAQRLQELGVIYENNPPERVDFGCLLDKNQLPVISSIYRYPCSDGECIIYKEPIATHPYVAAFDTAGEGQGDYYACHIMDNVTDEQVAVFHSLKMPADCILQIYGLLKLYNDALVAPEVNFDTLPLAKLREWQYTNIYQREKPEDSYSDSLLSKQGFRTTSANRKPMLSALQLWCKTNINKLNDVKTLQEMLTFTIQSKKIKGVFWAAEAGAHDDLVIALAILLQAKEQQSCEEQAEMKHIEGYWTNGELETALYKGEVDEMAVREYRLNNKHCANNVKRKGTSRYGR